MTLVPPTVLHMELLPGPATADVRPRLAAAIDACTSLRASVAYWTTPGDFVHPSLAQRLAAPHGFLCVDIHSPTNIDILEGLHTRGASVYLHLRALGIPTEPRSAGMPPHLLHAKMLLFDFANGEAELWTGSHNWTRRALAGPNVEASVVARIEKASPIYAQASSFLTWARSLCQPFDPENVAYYKFLQDGKQEEQAVRVIELEGEDAAELSGTVITIFGSDPRDLTELQSLGRTVCVSVEDSSSSDGACFLYSAEIRGVGDLKGASDDVGTISFDARRHAFRWGRTFPVLKPACAPQSSDVDRAYYFVTLRLGEMLEPGTRAYEPFEATRWVPEANDPLSDRTAPDFREMLVRGSRALMKVPAPPVSVELRSKLLPERRAETDRQLVSRKVIR